jgi:peptidoglycan/LPS O-acetylase OafA/YrhL
MNKYQKFKLKYDQIDKFLILRFLAAISVLVFHTSLINKNKIQFFGSDLTFLFWLDGITAVYFFFILSGFLISKAFWDKRYKFDLMSLLQFYWARIIRIAPLYYFTVILTTTFLYTNLLKPSNWHIFWRILIFDYNQDIFNSTKSFAFSNISLWAISTEVQFYILAPLLAFGVVKFCKNKFSTIILSSLILFLILWRRLVNLPLLSFVPAFPSQILERNYPFVHLFRDLDLFLWGMILPPILTHFQSFWDKVARFSLVLEFLVGTLLFVLSAWNVYFDRSFGISSILIFPFLISLFILINQSTNLPFVKKTYKWRAFWHNPILLLEFLGVFSYGIYLWHLPIFMTIAPNLDSSQFFANTGLGKILKKVIILACLGGFAVFSYFVVELPFSKVKLPKFLSKLGKIKIKK